ncbi:MAG: transposase [Bdellovibrionia bacterium]
MNYYIGIDAHSATCTGVVVNEKGDLLIREKFQTTEGNLIGFVRRLPSGRKSLTFEEATLAQWLYVTLKEEVDELIVCNPVYVAKKQGAKTDFRDALHLAQELRTGHLKGVYHDESHWIELRTLVNGYLALVQEIVRTKNRLKAVFRAEAIATSQSNFYTSKELTKQLSHSSGKFVAESLYEQIQSLEKFKIEYKLNFKKNLKRYKPIRNLTSIPGIDLIRASVITAVVCMPHRFANKHQFWGYCMLVRYIQTSDGRIYGNKRVHGRAELRDIFLGAAESVMRTDTSLRHYWDKLRTKGVKVKDAKIALARKIAAVCLCLLKNNETYNDNFKEEQTRRTETRKKIKLEAEV